MENKKNNTILIVIIVILTALLASCITYIIMDKKISNNKNVAEPIKKIEEDRELTKSEQDEMINLIESVYNLRVAYSYPLKNENGITNQELLEVGIQMVGKIEFSEDELKDSLNKYFYTKAYSNEDITCRICKKRILIYNKDSHIYTLDPEHPGHGGGASGVGSKAYYQSGKVTNGNEYVIKAKVLYERFCGDICGPLNSYYKSFKDSASSNNPVIGSINSDDEVNLTDEMYKNVEKDLPITTYVISKENGNYSLKSVTIE